MTVSIPRFEDIKITLSISGGRVDATVWSSDRSTFYAITINEFGTLCSCWAGLSDKICYHVKSLNIYLLEREVNLSQLMEMNKQMALRARKIETTVDGYNQTFGGLTIGLLQGHFGAPESGKTIMAEQFGCDILEYYLKMFDKAGNTDQPVSILTLDTEGGNAEEYLTAWLPVWNERYGFDAGIEYYRINMREWLRDPGPHVPLETRARSNKRAKFVVIDVDDVDRLNLIHGRPMTISYGKKKAKKDVYDGKDSGKITPLPQASWNEARYIWETPLAGWIEKFNVKGLIYDSFTQPTDVEFVGGQQSNPGRAAVNKVILGQAQKLTKEYDLVTQIIMHATRNPASFEAGVATGGKPVGHNFKIMGYTTKGKKVKKDETFKRRHMTAVRMPKFLPSRSFDYIIDDNGISDL
jgi:hypothetical protein